MQAGRVPGRCDILVAVPAGNVLVSRPTLGKGFKAEFGYDERIGFSTCARDPLCWIKRSKSHLSALKLSCAASLERLGVCVSKHRCDLPVLWGERVTSTLRRVRETRPRPCVHRAKTRALNPDASGQGSRQIGHPWPVVGGKRPCFPPCLGKRI